MSASRTRTPRERDVTEIIKGIERQIKALEIRAAEEDPFVARAMYDLRDQLDAAALRAITSLRDRGYRWADIGFDFDLTAAHAHKRWAHRI